MSTEPVALGATVTPNQRVARTVAQTGAAAAVIVVASWVGRLVGVDLDPGPGVDLPLEVSLAMQSIITAAVAWRMNRPSSTEETM